MAFLVYENGSLGETLEELLSQYDMSVGGTEGATPAVIFWFKRVLLLLLRGQRRYGVSFFLASYCCIRYRCYRNVSSPSRLDSICVS